MPMQWHLGCTVAKTLADRVNTLESSRSVTMTFMSIRRHIRVFSGSPYRGGGVNEYSSSGIRA